MPELMPIQLRALVVSDVDAVLRIQAQCYGESFVEPHEVFARRLCSPAHCSWAAVRGDEVVAYLAAYWSRPEAITPLNGDFACYEDASVLYLHDMAVSSAASGHGLARRMVDAAKTQARQRGIKRTALVSVQGSQAYWERQGYVVSNVKIAAQQQHLTSYGVGALYMVGLI